MVSVLGPERGLALVEKSGGAAAYIVHESASGLAVAASSRWAELSRVEH